MNKTININLAGIVFHLDEDAYFKLKEYLDLLREYFSHSEGRDEIISDIEARFAELFQEKLIQSKKEAIVLEDVQEAISIMGEPETYVEDEDLGYEKSFDSKSGDFKKNRRIFRDSNDQVVGGVCGGLGAYFNIDPIVFRLIFVVMFLGFGSGLLLYLLLWVIIPEAKTAAEKLQMRGEHVNVSNIGRVINEEMKDLKGRFKKSASNFEKKAREKDFRGMVSSGFDGLAGLFVMLLQLLGKIIGFAMVLLGLCFAVGLVAILLGAGPVLFEGHFFPMGWESVSDLIFSTDTQAGWAWIAVFIFIGIPIFHMLYLGIRLIFKVDPAPKALRIGASVVWFLSLVMLFGVGVQLGLEFDRGGVYDRHIEIKANTLQTDTLYLTVNKYDMFNRFDIRVEGEKVYSCDIDMDIKESKDEDVHIRVRSRARGGFRSEAYERAENVQYYIQQKGDTLVFDDHFTYTIKDKWRDQEVYITLYIPKGKAVFLEHKMREIIYDIDNVHNMWDGHMLNHYWVMKERGLTCTDCEEYEAEKD